MTAHHRHKEALLPQHNCFFLLILHFVALKLWKEYQNPGAHQNIPEIHHLCPFRT